MKNITMQGTILELDTENDFKITEETLDEEICRQGQLMLEYGDLMANLKAELANKEDQVKYTYAVIAQEIRVNAVSNKQKITENIVHEQVIVDKRYQSVLAEHNIVKLNSIKADNYWKAICKKGDLLNALGYKTGQEIKKLYG